MRLNQFIARAGICARRKAEALILAEKIQVNGNTITQLAYQVAPHDSVTYQGKVLVTEPFQYLLLNKPLNTVTTVADPQGRRTVIDLIQDAGSARIYPVGRLDRNTTGLLLLTNDGWLAQQLAHPAKKVTKVYDVTLRNQLQPQEMAQLKKGILLSDGWATVDHLKYLEKATQVRLTLHSGKNRIIRRMFEALRHRVTHLNRIAYGTLSTGTLPLGAWRPLTPAEVTHMAGNLADREAYLQDFAQDQVTTRRAASFSKHSRRS